MSEEIYGCKIEHNGDVNRGLEYLREHWDNEYTLSVFRNAKTSEYRTADFRIQGVDGTYILKFIGEHHFSLSWKNC